MVKATSQLIGTPVSYAQAVSKIKTEKQWQEIFSSQKSLIPIDPDQDNSKNFYFVQSCSSLALAENQSWCILQLTDGFLYQDVLISLPFATERLVLSNATFKRASSIGMKNNEDIPPGILVVTESLREGLNSSTFSPKHHALPCLSDVFPELYQRITTKPSIFPK